MNDIELVVGGAAVNGAIGDVVGSVYHGLTSTEAKIGGLLGPVGAVAGAIIHFKRNH
ncbi:hypothetical protein [Xanthomonas sp. XNM01]|uniref:hypothetical protein n=1 Tax=Xanthomonas sp. XNM01 TaxID=2769289 RepID=UPI001784BAE8|nr:hypothetical protein [Xanthomonas sp. XNM01]MBD9370065.1 hypothetical protein [Xanthomonas sp. XNM01]